MNTCDRCDGAKEIAQGQDGAPYEPCPKCKGTGSTPLKKYFVLYGDHAEYFVCEAEDADHAGEQCHDFTGGQTIHGIWEGVQDDNWVQ